MKLRHGLLTLAAILCIVPSVTFSGDGLAVNANDRHLKTAVKVLEQTTVPQVAAPSPARLVAVNPQTGEQIKWQVLASGGGRSASASYKVDMTVGQTAIGMVTSANFKLRQGFWQQFPVGCCSGLTGNVDCDPGDGVDISDLSALIDNLFISFTPLCCSAEANTDGQPGVDISDLSALIDFLFINFTPTAGCQ